MVRGMTCTVKVSVIQFLLKRLQGVCGGLVVTSPASAEAALHAQHLPTRWLLTGLHVGDERLLPSRHTLYFVLHDRAGFRTLTRCDNDQLPATSVCASFFSLLHLREDRPRQQDRVMNDCVQLRGGSDLLTA
jgi:hypothetical protein